MPFDHGHGVDTKRDSDVGDSEGDMAKSKIRDAESLGADSVLRMVGREELADATPPHESYEGFHRYDPGVTWTEEEERVVVWKTDLKLLTWICVMFFGLQLDRGNVSNALTDNFLEDMNLTSNDYNNGTTIQLVAFLTAEFPVTLLVKRFGFRRTLPCMMLMWGTVSWAQAWIKNRTEFYITRALIGACEGGFIPSAILFASYFYKSKELSVRLAFFWSTLNLARVASSLLAAGILKMRGIGGWEGWRYLFLLEGILTVILAVMRILRDDPAKGLTHLKEKITWSDVKSAWGDSSMWGLYFLGLIAYIPQSPVQGYLSLTLRRIGFSVFDSNMLSIPSAVLQIFLMLGLAKSSEFFGERSFHCIVGEFWSLPLLAALLGMGAGGQNWARFAITTLISGYPYFHPILSAWISENTFDVKKRAITAATYNCIVQVGSVISSQIYRADDSPYYYRGNKVLISICSLSLVVFVLQRAWLMRLNKRKEQLWEAMTAEERDIYRNDAAARKIDGNQRLDFRFKY